MKKTKFIQETIDPSPALISTEFDEENYHNRVINEAIGKLQHKINIVIKKQNKIIDKLKKLEEIEKDSYDISRSNKIMTRKKINEDIDEILNKG